MALQTRRPRWRGIATGLMIMQLGAVLVLGGCGDGGSPGGGDAAPSRPPAATSKPADVNTPPPTKRPADNRQGESVPAYCKRLQTVSTELRKIDLNDDLSASDKAKVKRSVGGMITNAPTDVRPAARVIGEALIAVAERPGSKKPSDKLGPEFATAVQRFATWVHKNCPGYRIDVSETIGS